MDALDKEVIVIIYNQLAEYLDEAEKFRDTNTREEINSTKKVSFGG